MRLVKDDDGKLLRYVWPGGYPLFYYDNGGNALCAKCADEMVNAPDESTIEGYDVNWENADLLCDNCGAWIECAYCD